MKCAWDSLLQILPPRIRSGVDKQNRVALQEIRLRLFRDPKFLLTNGQAFLSGAVQQEEINYVINTASRFSPWTASTLASGYLTIAGGHRIGVCGDAIIQDGAMKGIRSPTSLCIRVAKEFHGIGEKAPKSGSLLIIGPPGSGKTTLLRDIIRLRSQSRQVSVVDERGELFPNGSGFEQNGMLDVLSFCGKKHGIETVLRSMGPQVIAVDEVTSEEDCKALLHAGWSGTELLATVHAFGISDLKKRLLYRPLIEMNLFDIYIVMKPDKSWQVELACS